MISDDGIASIGTANIDVRSFEHNYEVNAIVYDTEFIKKLKLDFLTDSSESKLLTYKEHQKRPWSDRLKEGFAKVFSPVL
jgi:cardiolipin synthase